MKQIIDNVWNFKGLVAGRVYLVKDPDGLSLIDTGLLGAAPKIARALEAANYKPNDVKRILITHAHPDHVGGLPELAKYTGAEVISSTLEKPVVEGEAPVERPPKELLTGMSRMMAQKPALLKGTPVNRSVSDGDMIPEVLGGLQVIFTPGHAPGHISFWQPDLKFLFLGDVLFHLLGLRLPPAAFTPDMRENIRSLHKVTALEPDSVCFGHGEPFVGDAARRLNNYVALLDAKLSELDLPA